MSKYNQYKKIEGSETDYDNKNDNYPEFQESVNEYFKTFVDGKVPLFTTNTNDLFDIYLDNIVLSARQHYNCNACRSFVKKYGDLVTIDEDGNTKSVLWNEDMAPEFFKPSVRAMRNAVEKSSIKDVFISDVNILGNPVTNGWEHLSVTLPNILLNKSMIKNASQIISEKHEDFKMLTNACMEYDLPIVNQAKTLLESETLYRGNKTLGIAIWFKELLENRKRLNKNDKKANITWLAVAKAPVGFCHIRSSMIGTLLDDLKNGLSIQSVSARFAEKMNPANYQRSQSIPSENAIYEAEKVVMKLGIADSLKRRYAKYEEIPEFIWESSSQNENATTENKKKLSIFGHLKPKNSTEQLMDIPQTIMTWEKFQRTILPTASNIEVKVDNPNRFMALVTATDVEAPNILQWDNNVSWYYHGGIDGEIKRRVEEAGGRYENNEIRCSLIWEGYTDLDLHCITPTNEHIYYGHKNGRCNGYLDVDANGGRPTTLYPVENIRWSCNAPNGNYRFYIHNYCERGRGTTPFKVELEVNGNIYSFNGIANDTGYKEDIFSFNYKKDKPLQIHGQNSSFIRESWNVEENSFVKVKGITYSPNLWGENPVEHSGKHVFFILEGCKDMLEGKGRGFFVETLKPELREIRKTLELYTSNTPIEDVDGASACGVGHSKDCEWNMILKVTTNNSTRIIKIDRFD